MEIAIALALLVILLMVIVLLCLKLSKKPETIEVQQAVQITTATTNLPIVVLDHHAPEKEYEKAVAQAVLYHLNRTSFLVATGDNLKTDVMTSLHNREEYLRARAYQGNTYSLLQTQYFLSLLVNSYGRLSKKCRGYFTSEEHRKFEEMCSNALKEPNVQNFSAVDQAFDKICALLNGKKPNAKTAIHLTKAYHSYTGAFVLFLMSEEARKRRFEEYDEFLSFIRSNEIYISLF